MSASLVGSEMCIRDSMSGRRRCRASRGASGVRICNIGGSDLRRFRAAAVSYTHLTLPTICSV
eukprot:7897563-Alexandrium_andersonii.AAC.1